MLLPIDSILPEMRSLFRHYGNVVLSAEPGAGKTTRVPPALKQEEWLSGKKMIMLEPRRLAAVRSAEYMARQLNENVGETVGYRIRGESKISGRTTIEIVTEGVLTRMIQDDPSLQEYGLVIFDEFHERSIHADLGLALTLDAQSSLRNDLKILVMSATLNSAAIAELIPSSKIIESTGRSYPVETHYLANDPDDRIERVAVNAILKALKKDEGDILVFLPGQREIRMVETLLQEKELPNSVTVHSLFGDASGDKQRAALTPAPSGRRKVILSTNIAETSITIDGVRIVIDSGLSRISKFDPRRGMAGLITVPVSRSSADQRKGRAGRQQSGVCYRLWSESRHTQLPEYSQPEILITDLAAFALDLAEWGDSAATHLKFIDAPPASNLLQAQKLLRYLGAVDDRNTITGHGKKMAAVPVHPRLAHMMIVAKEINLGPVACDVAALLDERDVLRGKAQNDIDLRSRYDAVKNGMTTDNNARKRIVDQSTRLQRIMGLSPRPFGQSADVEKLGVLLALVYPDRIGKRKSGDRYQLSGNTMGVLPKESYLFREKYIAVGEVDGAGTDVKIFLAEPIAEGDIVLHFKDRIVERSETYWSETDECVAGRKVTALGAVELLSTAVTPDPDDAKRLMIERLRGDGIEALPWNEHAILLRKRSEWLRTNGIVREPWPDLSGVKLSSEFENWFGPFLDGIVRRSQLKKIDMVGVMHSFFTHRQLSDIDRLAPTHCTVPTGSRIAIDYSQTQPVLAVRIQEMFGEKETPTVGGGKVNVLLHLLSPARRPLAITQDLPSFWKNVYPEVRKDMRGQYPKHYWPENPLEAEPTRKTKKWM
ncbi:MAG: ATP-dependent helicase HrpB [Bacteroidota bacterium]